jgi:hypothetical protein
MAEIARILRKCNKLNELIKHVGFQDKIKIGFQCYCCEKYANFREHMGGLYFIYNECIQILHTNTEQNYLKYIIKHT